MVFVGFVSEAAALRTESAILPHMPLHMENIAQWMRKNTRLGAELVQPKQWAQLEPAAHRLLVVG
jgi:hypothetical protein